MNIDKLELSNNNRNKPQAFAKIPSKLKPKLTHSMNSNNESNRFNNFSVSCSTSNIFETPFERKIRKQQDLVIEGKNNQQIIYESDKNSYANVDEESLEQRDLSRLYQSLDGKLNNNLEFKNKFLNENNNNYNTHNQNYNNVSNDNIRSVYYNTNSNRNILNINNTTNKYNNKNSSTANSLLTNFNNMKINNPSLINQINSNPILQNIDIKKYKMSATRLLTLNYISKITIINFLDSKDYYSFALSSQSFFNILIDYFKVFCRKIVDSFNSEYKRQLHCAKPKMIVNKVKDIRGKKLLISLIIKAEIFSVKLINSTVSLGYLSKYYTDKISHSNVFKFDVLENNKVGEYWLLREYTSVS